MAKVVLQCPSCGGQVELGDIECKHCGVNLKSGESYESQLRRARGKDEHPEHFGSPILIGVALAFALVLFAGYMYERRVKKAVDEFRSYWAQQVEWDMVEGPNPVDHGVAMLREIRGMADAGRKEEAKARAEELIQTLKAAADEIKPPKPYAGDEDDPYHRRSAKYGRATIKRLLSNLKAKAERLRDDIESS